MIENVSKVRDRVLALRGPASSIELIAKKWEENGSRNPLECAEFLREAEELDRKSAHLFKIQVLCVAVAISLCGLAAFARHHSGILVPLWGIAAIIGVCAVALYAIAVCRKEYRIRVIGLLERGTRKEVMNFYEVIVGFANKAGVTLDELVMLSPLELYWVAGENLQDVQETEDPVALALRILKNPGSGATWH